MATAFCKNVQKYDDWCKSCMQPKICSKMSAEMLLKQNSIFSGINFMLLPLRILQIGWRNWLLDPEGSIDLSWINVVFTFWAHSTSLANAAASKMLRLSAPPLSSSRNIPSKSSARSVYSWRQCLKSIFFLRLWRWGILYFLSPALHLKPKRCSTREGSALTRKFTELESSQGKTLAYFSLPPATKRKNISSVCPYQTFSGRS